jgi:hypothetical protein
LSEPPTPDGDLFHEETDDPLLADRRNFFFRVPIKGGDHG